MSDRERIADNVAALTVGWREHIEYAVNVTVHVNGCAHHEMCLCPERTEARARTVTHPALLAQLQQESTNLSGRMNSVRPSSKPGSRPPGNIAPLLLIDTIGEQARYWYAELWWQVKGTPAPLGNGLKLVGILRNMVTLSEQAHEHPMLVREIAGVSRSWVNKARVLLGYQKPHVTLKNSVCGECGGALAVASDAGSDVRCIGTPETSGCGVVYRREDWASMLV